jgi:hypothetical protein
MVPLELVVLGSTTASVTFCCRKATNCFLPLTGDMKWRTAMGGLPGTPMGTWKNWANASHLISAGFSFSWSSVVGAYIGAPLPLLGICVPLIEEL